MATTVVDDMRSYIQTNGLTGIMTTVNNTINSAPLTVLERRIIADPTFYAECLNYAFKTELVAHTDANGIYQAVLRNLATLVKDFYRLLILEVLSSRSIAAPTSDELNSMLDLVIMTGVPITAGDAAQPIIDIYNLVKEEGPIRYFVNLYLGKVPGKPASIDIDSAQISESVISSMVDYLKSMKVKLPATPVLMDAAILNSSLDGYLALALDYALKVESGGIDPIDLYRVKGSQSSWDFSVDLFDTASKQGIVSKNILGAGAVNYIFVLGEQLQIFNLAEALILEWARGGIFITDSAMESKLYRYYKLLEDRANADERGMLYKRVLNLGNAQLLQGTVVNETFTQLWSSLMNEIVSYIQKTESSNNVELVSRLPIIQLMRELQYNLTTFFTGMAHIQTTEMYNHLQDALEIMSSDSIISQVAPGRSRNVWSVIDVLHQDKLGTSPNITAYKTAAVEGYKLFNFISTFNETTATRSDFTSFIISAESYILALSQDGTANGGGNQQRLASKDAFADVEEEFEDWEG
jgi:hypothetical protein